MAHFPQTSDAKFLKKINSEHNEPKQIIYISIPNESNDGNGMGIAGFILALIGIFVWNIPILGWIIWLLGFIFSIIGLYGIPTRFAAYGFIVSLTLGAGQLEYMF